jgi:hypothetical protein
MSMLTELRPGDWAVYEAWWDLRPKTVIYLGPDDERPDRAWAQENMASGFPFCVYVDQLTPVESTENSMTIYASPFISVLWNGRKPTSFGAKKGNHTLQKSILDWINKKGISGKANAQGNVPTSEQLSWGISKSIHLNGTKLYQQGGKQNIFDTILTSNRIDNLLSLISDKYYIQITNIVKK